VDTRGHIGYRGGDEENRRRALSETKAESRGKEGDVEASCREKVISLPTGLCQQEQ
jgi:hypothetical protein